MSKVKDLGNDAPLLIHKNQREDVIEELDANRAFHARNSRYGTRKFDREYAVMPKLAARRWRRSVFNNGQVLVHAQILQRSVADADIVGQRMKDAR